MKITIPPDTIYRGGTLCNSSFEGYIFTLPCRCGRNFGYHESLDQLKQTIDFFIEMHDRRHANYNKSENE